MVGVPGGEWAKVVAAVVLAEGGAVSERAREWVSAACASKTPARIAFVTELPYNETGKLLRRELKGQLAEEFGS